MTDRMARFVTDAGYAAAVVRSPATVREIACDQHQLSGTPAGVLGEAIVGALLLATRLKGPGLLTFSLATDGVFDHFRCDAIGLGSVRAMVLPRTHERLAGWNGVDRLIGDGLVTVGRQLREEEEPYHSKLLVQAESVPRIVNDYLVASEQVPAAIGVVADGDQRAVGLYLERLPGGDPEHPLMTRLLHLREQPDAFDHAAADPATLLAELCPEATFRQLHEYGVGFHCPCSRSRYVANLRNFSTDQLRELSNGAGVIETRCDFCRSFYPIPLDDLV